MKVGTVLTGKYGGSFNLTISTVDRQIKFPVDGNVSAVSGNVGTGTINYC